MPKRRSKRLAIKARKRNKVKSAKKRARAKKEQDRRVSIGDALGVSPTRDREANLAEDHAMASAIAAARRLNTARKAVPTYAPSRRSSFALM